MDGVDLKAQLPAVVAREWGLRVDAVELTIGGMNSLTATVATTSGRFIAKWVPAADREGLIRGAHTARAMSDLGIRAGAPALTRSGAVTTAFLDGELALLEEVTGVPLSNSQADQADWGSSLATVHAAQPQSPGAGFYEWLADNAEDPLHPRWVREAVAIVYTEYAGLPPLTWALLHTDPAPEAFLRDTAGNIGIIDWTGSVPGPALYDVASAVMYAGGEAHARPMLAAYARVSAMPTTELHGHLRSLRRLRAGVQADYFSRRLHQNDLTGVDSTDDNAQGLTDAREMLQSLGVRVGPE